MSELYLDKIPCPHCGNWIDEEYPDTVRDENLAKARAELDRLTKAGDGLAHNVNPCLLEMARHAIGNTNVAVIAHWIQQWDNARLPTPRPKEADKS